MEIEVFEEEEVRQLTAEDVVECSELIERLSLTGQQKFYKGTEALKVCPYRRITVQEQFVYGTLLPSQTLLSLYDASPVPLRILQVAAHAKEVIDGYPELVVYHQPNPKADPVLVARIGNQYSPDAIYLLARWGEALEEFSVLADRARQRWIEGAKGTLRRIETEVRSAIEHIEERSHRVVAEGKAPGYHFWE